MASSKDEGCSVVAKFFENKIIFITGGTGFMGKVIVEKLLHSCPGIKKIYVLVRSKQGEDRNERLDKIKNGHVFQDLSAKYPERLSKLEALEGDIELPGLGLSDEGRQALKQVNVVFNVAATINFKVDFRKSVAVNIIATQTLLETCLTMTDLKSFVHVSTAYSNSDRTRIEEKVYPAPLDLQDLLQQCRDCPDHQVQALTARLLGNKQNIYVLTKAMAENVVNSYGDKFPIAIVRPSIVTASMLTPHPGWVDTKSGITGMLSATVSGMLRTLYASGDIVLDIIPVDLVDNIIIVTAWKTAQLGVREPTVYNAVSGAVNKCVLRDLFQYVIAHSYEMPQDLLFWFPAMYFTQSRWLHTLARFCLHTVPAYLHDRIVAPNSKVRLERLSASVRKAADAVEYFGCIDFDFAYDNIPLLIKELNGLDRDKFPIDISQIDWFIYTATYVRGMRKYLLGQRDENLPSARSRMHMLYVKDKALKIGAIAAAYYFVIMWATPLMLP